MSDEVKMDGVGVSPSVLDTIVTLAAQEVEGVACVGHTGIAGMVQKGSKKVPGPVVVTVGEDGAVSVTVHLQVVYGNRLRDVAESVQTAVGEALSSQVGVDVGTVDVYIDGLVFNG